MSQARLSSLTTWPRRPGGEADGAAGRRLTASPASLVRTSALLAFLLLLARGAGARVVINEVFYHGPDDLEDLEYVELHNSGDQAVDLAGWSICKGVEYKFEPGARLEAGGFLVLCRNRDRFQGFYQRPVNGLFHGQSAN